MRNVPATSGRALSVLLALVLLAAPARAHGGPGIAGASVDAPTWLFLLTGGIAVVAPVLLTAFVTDRKLLTAASERRLPVPNGAAVRRWGGRVAGAVGLLALGAVLVVGVAGPAEADRNVAVLLVWVVWWAGVTASAYLVGDAWPALDPFARLTSPLPDRGRVSLPGWVGRWPAVAGLLLLVWLEIVTGVATDPGQLSAVVAAYAVATLLGSAVLGREAWRRQVDPVAGVFELYGRVAPIQRTDDGLTVTAPGAGLIDDGTTRASEAGFVLALLWVTWFDGFVATPSWQRLAAPAVGTGAPGELVYFAALLAGYALCVGVYWGVAETVRGSVTKPARTVGTFAPALVPIAAGYHLAHYLPYLLQQLPTTVVVAADPLTPPTAPPILGLPEWIGWVGPVAVLTGHLLAVGVAHARSVGVSEKRGATRRRYLAVVTLCTIGALWLLAQPTIDAPFL